LLKRYLAGSKTAKEAMMPLFPIILWAGVPIVVLGGGYWIGHAAHWF
jgi:hypothetical protein